MKTSSAGQDGEGAALESWPPERHAYGTDPAQYGELYRPVGRPRGVAVVIHGGFWRAKYTALLGRPLARDLAEHGWAAWNLEYRRVGNGGGHLTTLDDVSAGIDHLAVLENLDLSTVVTIGHSAGGHLATFAAGRQRYQRWSTSKVSVTAVIAQAAVMDLVAARRAALGNGAVDNYVGGPDVPINVETDPYQQIPLPVPVWCIHGWGDHEVPVAQSLSYVQQARGQGARANLVALDGDHFTVVDPDSVAWAVTRQLLDSLSTVPNDQSHLAGPAGEHIR
ncbi:alpha/beta hydrolase family protein [Streptomyces endocoffeicus]|uniref:alpha/beta hydrolase family protein n=1 Tax=Streptomyces endocoffeicus TaxID=2898945 RepID=UPI001E54CA5E|nr:alpha/beta hydrolase [Streptomyces endocoffeicus]